MLVQYSCVGHSGQHAVSSLSVLQDFSQLAECGIVGNIIVVNTTDLFHPTI